MGFEIMATLYKQTKIQEKLLFPHTCDMKNSDVCSASCHLWFISVYPHVALFFPLWGLSQTGYRTKMELLQSQQSAPTLRVYVTGGLYHFKRRMCLVASH